MTENVDSHTSENGGIFQEKNVEIQREKSNDIENNNPSDKSSHISINVVEDAKSSDIRTPDITQEKLNKKISLNDLDEKEEWINLLDKDKSSKNSEKQINKMKDNPGISPTHSYKSNISSNSSYYTVSNAPNIICKSHGNQFIGVDSRNFKLICKKCIDLGLKTKELTFSNNDIIPVENNSNNSDENYYCDNHFETKAVFFCDDCNNFLCKDCFANSHRNHNSNLPKYMATKFVENCKSFLTGLSQVQPTLESSLEEISEMNKNIKEIRDLTNKKLKDGVSNITNVNKTKLDYFTKDFSKLFYGLDIEVENVYNRLLTLQKRLSKFNSALNEMDNFMTTRTKSYEICSYKKSKQILITDIRNVINESKNLLGYKIETITKQSKEKFEEIKKTVASFERQLSVFEKSTVNTINSGMTNYSVVLRRFSRFSRRGLKYYKSSSIYIKVNKPVFLTGVGLCGLYISSKKFLNPNSNIINDMNARGLIQIEMKLFELKDNGSNDLRLNENSTLYGIINKSDPTFLIYFKKPVYLKQEAKYLLTIINNDSNCYIDIWGGEVNRKCVEKMEQTINCHCNNVNFTFTPAEGVESDFNEFNLGIIGSLIYSYID